MPMTNFDDYYLVALAVISKNESFCMDDVEDGDRMAMAIAKAMTDHDSNNSRSAQEIRKLRSMVLFMRAAIETLLRGIGSTAAVEAEMAGLDERMKRAVLKAEAESISNGNLKEYDAILESVVP